MQRSIACARSPFVPAPGRVGVVRYASLISKGMKMFQSSGS